MSRTVSSSMKEAVFGQRTPEAFLILLTIDHDDLAEPIRITPDPFEVLPILGIRGVVSNGVEYSALPFEFILPGDSPDSPPISTIRMDNISREIVNAIRSITSPPTATISIVLSSDPDVVEITLTDFTLNNIRADVYTVEGELSTEQLDAEPLPSGRFTPGLFPGLF